MNLRTTVTHMTLTSLLPVGTIQRIREERDGVQDDHDHLHIRVGCSPFGEVGPAYRTLRGHTVVEIAFERVLPEDVRRASPEVWSLLGRCALTTVCAAQREDA